MTNYSFIFFTLVLAFFITKRFICLLSKRASSDTYRDFKNTISANKLVIVLRVYNELKSVERFSKEWKDLSSCYKQIDLVIVGACKERFEGNPKTTIEAFKGSLNGVERTCYYELKDSFGIARQTNFGIKEYIKQSSCDTSKTWIKTIDIDTELSHEVINEIFSAMDNNYHVIEVPALFYKNYNQLTPLQKLHAVYQSSWSLDVEQFRGFLKNKWKFIYSTVSGAGACFNLKYLLSLGLLPEDVKAEDIAISSVINSRKTAIKTTSNMIESDMPTTLAEGFDQEVRWAEGSIDSILYALKNRVDMQVSISSIVNVVYFNGVWALFTPVIMFLLYISMISSNILWASPVIFLCLTYFYRVTKEEMKRGGSFISSITLMCYLPFQLARISTPWWYAFFLKLIGFNSKCKVHKSSHD